MLEKIWGKNISSKAQENFLKMSTLAKNGGDNYFHIGIWLVFYLIFYRCTLNEPFSELREPFDLIFEYVSDAVWNIHFQISTRVFCDYKYKIMTGWYYSSRITPQLQVSSSIFGQSCHFQKIRLSFRENIFTSDFF